MTVLARELEAVLQPGMHLPRPLALLFEWIEERGFYEGDGPRIGLLHPPDLDWQSRPAPDIGFWARGSSHLRHWFGHDEATVLNRLCVFASTGGDGSMAALWLDDAGQQKIVHLGSGSGSTMVCVLADDAVDFLRLLAIGYAEICWPDELAVPPRADGPPPNLELRNWVEATFDVSIPRTALDIIKSTADMADRASADPFCRWLQSVSR